MICAECKGEEWEFYCRKCGQGESYKAAKERIAALERVLKSILKAHELSNVDWDAMREGEKLMEGRE